MEKSWNCDFEFCGNPVTSLDTYNGLSQIYSIKQEGIIHLIYKPKSEFQHHPSDWM